MMIKGDYDKLKEIADHNLCAEHKKPLEAAWYGDEKCYALRCGEGHYPDAVTGILSFSKEVKTGMQEEFYEASQTIKREEMKEKQKTTKPTAVTFPGVPATDLATGELLHPDIIIALVDYARKYHLDPVRGHVCVMYSRPYITIDGYLYHANRSNIAYSLMSRPMTTDEEKDYKIGPTDIAWIAKIKMVTTNQEFTGLGIVTYDEMTEESKKSPGQLKSPVVAKHPQMLAQKRAEWQVLRRAFPIGSDKNSGPE